jgi:hypothetical protein
MTPEQKQNDNNDPRADSLDELHRIRYGMFARCSSLMRVQIVDSDASRIICRPAIKNVADAHRGDGKRLVVHANEKLPAFLELGAAVRACGELF